ncbi:TRAP transporter substrate-binding protein [Chromohalobacter beijerinckii]|uniref:TRAP transporter substrate-binding protein n=1 Tax=Chromohalobacter beijerinckii TaxID=86179 RepID=A0ABV8X8Q1_9GAMM|nr:TRAP transporter substrate-binding protein [Chromohalobacter beijerinckii]MCK0766790.1 TRAP transporter substrate-binding protein [Chromohalobacter beijerinckii]
MRNIKALSALCLGMLAPIAAEALTLKTADSHSENDSTVKALKFMSQELEKSTNGDIKLKIYPNSTLGDGIQVLQQVQRGNVDIARVSALNLSVFNPELGLFSMPYLFEDMDHFERFLESGAAEKTLSSIEDGGNFVGLSYFTNGFRSFYTQNQSILTPEDLEGLKIRVMSNPDSIKMVELLGGQPTPMSFSEVYGALEQGVIDGGETAITGLTNGGLGEVAKAFSLDEHTLIPDVVVVSKKTWDSLDPQQKESLVKAMEKTQDYQHSLYLEDVSESKKIAEKEMGVEFHEVDKQAFKEKAAPMYKELTDAQQGIVKEIESLAK